MKAAILIGGQGTRLRPFTETVPKSLLPVLNRPFLLRQLEQLKEHGVREAVLCTGFQAAAFRRLGSGRGLGIKLSFSHETSPLGTGGALRKARRLFPAGEPMLALNGDVLLDRFDFTAFLSAHKRRGARASIALARVDDPTLYGLVRADRQGRVLAFVEKPSAEEAKANTINAGAYLLELSALEGVAEGQPCSIEREIFPQLVKQGAVYGFEGRGYWIDFGTIERYRQVHLDILGGRTAIKPAGAARPGGLWVERGATVARGVVVEGAGWKVVGAGSRVAAGAALIGRVCVGPKCDIGAGARLQDCVILEGASVPAGAHLSGCVLGKAGAAGAKLAA